MYMIKGIMVRNYRKIFCKFAENFQYAFHFIIHLYNYIIDIYNHIIGKI